MFPRTEELCLCSVQLALGCMEVWLSQKFTKSLVDITNFYNQPDASDAIYVEIAEVILNQKATEMGEVTEYGEHFLALDSVHASLVVYNNVCPYGSSCVYLYSI